VKYISIISLLYEKCVFIHNFFLSFAHNIVFNVKLLEDEIIFFFLIWVLRKA